MIDVVELWNRVCGPCLAIGQHAQGRHRNPDFPEYLCDYCWSEKTGEPLPPQTRGV